MAQDSGNWLVDTTKGRFTGAMLLIVAVAWSGVEDCVSDGIPVIGRSASHKGLYYSFGYPTHGFQMGSGVGELLAESIAGGLDNELFAALSIARF